MIRLPTPSGDVNSWGSILNEFLSVAHNADGEQKVSLHTDVFIMPFDAYIGSNVLPPGLRVSDDVTLTDILARCGTAPTGSGLTVVVRANGTSVGSVTIAAGATTGSTTGLTADLSTGDILTFDITAIGSTLPGADIALTLLGSE